MRHSGYRGFTLIELLVVIAIIAILAAILFPVFAQAREKARQASCSSNMRQIALGIIQYTEDYDETYPQAQDNNWNDPWSVEITPYLKSAQVFRCPDDSPNPVPAAYSWAGPEISYVVNGNYQWNGDAGHNEFGGLFLPFADLDVTDNYASDHSMHVRALAEVTYPAATVMVAERNTVWKPEGSCPQAMGSLYLWGRSYVGFSWDGNPCVDSTYAFGPIIIPNGGIAPTSNPYDPAGPNGGVMAVHNGMANFAFADGHVKAMKPGATNPTMYATGNAKNMWFSTRTQQ